VSRFEVPMPQMGESIAEGTVSKWLRTIGQRVEKDEPILEISTDKVDAEIPSPVSGVLAKVCVEEGQTVEVGTVLAYVEADGGEQNVSGGEADSSQQQPKMFPQPTTIGESSIGHASEATAHKNKRELSETERLKNKSSPVVRRIAKEHGISIDNVPGTGHLERVTKADILRYIKDASIHSNYQSPDDIVSSQAVGDPDEGLQTLSRGEIDIWSSYYGEVEHPTFPTLPGDKVLPMDRLRQLTADHMVMAKRVAPHVHSVIEVDFSSVDQVRTKIAQNDISRGRGFSYTAFVTWACSRLLGKYGNINAVLSGKDIIYRNSVNIGIAVDLDPGLIVPVAKDADELSLAETSGLINELAVKARSGNLSPEEIQGSTFTITNPGILGTLVGIPIIPHGTSAILVLGAIEKRPVVIENVDTGKDEVVVRKTSLFSLGFDHRIVDGADAARFLLDLKKLLEFFPENV